MKRNLFLIAAGALLFLLGFQLGRLQGGGHPDAQPAPQETAAIDEEALTSTECDGELLDESVQFTDYRGERVSPMQYAGDSTIIARFSTSACRPCVDALTASLQRHAGEHPSQRYLVLLKNVQPRDLYVVQADFGPQFTLLASDSLPIDFDNGETPVLFQIDAAGRVRNHFTCRYGDYARTDRYLDTL